MGCCGDNGYDNNCPEREGDCAAFFPDDIRGLLRKLACDTVVLTYRNNGNREKVRIECISGNLLVVKEECNYKFIDIDCICAVSACSDTILNRVIKPFGNCC